MGLRDRDVRHMLGTRVLADGGAIGGHTPAFFDVDADGIFEAVSRQGSHTVLATLH